MSATEVTTADPETADTEADGETVSDRLAGLPEPNQQAVRDNLHRIEEAMIQYASLGDDPEWIETAGDISARTVKLLSRHSDLLEEVPRKRWKLVDSALEQILGVLAEQSARADVSAAELENHAQAAVDVFRVIVEGDSESLQSLLDSLKPVDTADPETINDAEAEARGRLRLRALYRKLIQDSYTVANLTEEGELSRQRIQQLREADKLFAVKVPFQRSFLYPVWQFEPGSPKPRQVMPLLVKAAREADLDPIAFHQLMSNPEAGGGQAPCEMLDEGREDLVLGIIAANR